MRGKIVSYMSTNSQSVKNQCKINVTLKCKSEEIVTCNIEATLM